MVKKNQGSALVILLVLSLLIGILVTVYFFKNNGKDCGGFMGTTCSFGFSCKIIGGDSGKCKNILFPISTPSNELTPEVAKKTLPLPDPTANWKTYTSATLGFALKTPENFTTLESKDFVTISSPIYSCETSVSGSRQKTNVSDVEILIKKLADGNYNDIWKKTFEFDFDGKGDGYIMIDGTKAFYFYQGAESLLSRQAILAKSNFGSVYEIDVFGPLLVNNCQYPKERFSGINNQILSTFKFL